MNSRKLIIIVSLALFGTWLVFVIGPVVSAETDYHLRTSGINLLAVNKPVWFDKEEPRLIIPGIFLDELIKFGVNISDQKASEEALKNSVVQAAGTGFPGSGKMGYYFAHSSHPSFFSGHKPPFALLAKLRSGDLVFIAYNGTKYGYVVTGSKIIEPTDTSFLDQAYEEETIVLQGCWPPLTTWKRLSDGFQKSANGRRFIQLYL